jgi:RNA polymerase sigma-70 factor, ECF subfamily
MTDTGEPDLLALTMERERQADFDLVRRAVAGEKEAFEQIYWRHHRRVFLICSKIIKDPSASEDLTQEVFVKLFRKMSTFRGEARLSTWLYRTAVNEALMHIRSRKSRREELTESGEVPEYFSNGGEARALLDRLTLEEAVEMLPRGYRNVFVLHDVNGFGHDEIAGLLGCAPGTSKSQLSKARTKLRRFLRHARVQPAR